MVQTAIEHSSSTRSLPICWQSYPHLLHYKKALQLLESFSLLLSVRL